jgi:tetratricopeptide (TPR) repeat protein
MRMKLILLSIVVILIACNTTNSLLKKADQNFNVGKYNDAILNLKTILKKQPEHTEALLKLGTNYAYLGNIDNAVHYMSIILEQDSAYIPQVTKAYWQAAKINQENKRIDLALKSLKEILELDPAYNFSDMTFLLADSLFVEKDYRRALQVYQKEVEKDSLNPSLQRSWALFQLGLCQENLGYLDDAVRTFRIMAEDYPRDPNLAKAFWHQSQCAYQIAEKLLDENKLGEALEMARLVNRNGLPENIQDKAWFLQGEIFLQLGDLVNAEIAYLKVLDLNPYRTGRLVERAAQRIREVRNQRK